MGDDRVRKNSMANKPKPAKKIRNTSPAAGAEFNFAEYKKATLADPQARKVVEDFLKYRHREWEKNLAAMSILDSRAADEIAGHDGVPTTGTAPNRKE